MAGKYCWTPGLCAPQRAPLPGLKAEPAKAGPLGALSLGGPLCRFKLGLQAIAKPISRTR
jgi:hypothetical protein